MRTVLTAAVAALALTIVVSPAHAMMHGGGSHGGGFHGGGFHGGGFHQGGGGFHDGRGGIRDGDFHRDGFRRDGFREHEFSERGFRDDRFRGRDRDWRGRGWRGDGVFWGGLALGSALAYSDFDDGYDFAPAYEDDRYGGGEVYDRGEALDDRGDCSCGGERDYAVCTDSERVWDPEVGRYVIVRRTYGC